MSRSLPSCRRWRQGLSLLASGTLPEEERGPLEAHLAGCERCRSHREQLDRVTAGLHSLSQSAEAVEPSASLRGRWTRAVRAEPPAAPILAVVREALTRARALATRPAWVGVAAVWLAILFFRVTSPAVAEWPDVGPAPEPRQLYLALRDPDWRRPRNADPLPNRRAGDPKPAPAGPRSQGSPGNGTA